MIVTRMTEAELVAELMRDLRAAMAYSDTKNQIVRRRVIKATRFPVKMESEFVSPRKNRWLLFFEAKNKKEIDDNIRLTFVCVYNTPIGWHAAMFSSLKNHNYWCIFPPHFFSRYRLRTDREETGIDLIKEYFRLNFDFAYKVEKEGLFASSTEGVGFAMETIGGNLLFKTFLTPEMLRSDQIEVHLENELLLYARREGKI